MAVKVGSFAKSTDGAPVSQAISGVGFTPKALLMWTVCATADGWSDSCVHAFGFTSGAATSYSMGFASDDNVDKSNTGKRQAAKALTICSATPAAIAECDLASFDADGFTLNWTTNDASAYIVHYMALGGGSLTNAKAFEWAISTGTGNQAVTGVGFQPDCVLHLCQYNDNALPSDSTGSNSEVLLSLGAMTAADQWVVAFGSWDDKAAGASSRTSNQGLCINSFSVTTVDTLRLAYVSMDADGFTMNVIENSLTTAPLVLSLALKGGSYDIDGVQKPTTAAPVSQAVTGIAFQPEGVFLATAARTVEESSSAPNGRLMIGASDGTTEGCVALQDDSGADPTNTARFDSVSKVISYGDNDTQTTENAADLTSLDANGFTMNWTANAATANYFYYFAFAGGAAATAAPKMMYYKRLRQ